MGGRKKEESAYERNIEPDDSGGYWCHQKKYLCRRWDIPTGWERCGWIDKEIYGSWFAGAWQNDNQWLYCLLTNSRPELFTEQYLN